MTGPYQRSFERRLKIGVVGVGSHSYRNLLPTLTFLPVELVAICDRDRDLAIRTAEQYGARSVHTSSTDMIEEAELDAVLLCVSPQMHPELAVEALRAGLHVWMEKPAGTSTAEIEGMLAARGDRTVVVGYKKAFQPATQKAAEVVRQHGQVKSLYGVYPMVIPNAADADFDPRATTRWLADGCHPLSVLLEVCGPVDGVAVHRSSHGGGSCVLAFASGAVGTLVLADGAPVSQPFERYEFFLDGASVAIEDNRRVAYQRGTPMEYGVTTTFAPPGLDHGAMVWEVQNGLNTLENKALFTQGVYDELAHFVESALDGRPAKRGTLEFAIEVTKVYEAALRSQGDWVAVG